MKEKIRIGILGCFLILNPGSVSQPRGGKPSFAILETEENELRSVIVDWIL